ncbi:DDB1- and CUL4-associated factor-like protein, partial [Trifolium medium]|nr:DDB1- and CUL4-associated factor-like protein [Trifolium medium]
MMIVSKSAVLEVKISQILFGKQSKLLKLKLDQPRHLKKLSKQLEYKSTNDEEAAVLAASRAASTVIDAASAVEVS